tara:strand:- start:11 stop:565 length:555 start_codon:yes stop_codon:yes gene_type:complete
MVKDYFIVPSAQGVSYVVFKDLTAYRNDGKKMDFIIRGPNFGFYYGWRTNGKKFSKVDRIAKTYATHFIPNPEGHKFARLNDPSLGVAIENIVWVANINRKPRRTQSELTQENLIRYSELQEKKTKEAEAERVAALDKKRVKLMDPKDSIIKPLDKYFLRKEDYNLAILDTKPKPRLDANFKRI